LELPPDEPEEPDDPGLAPEEPMEVCEVPVLLLPRPEPVAEPALSSEPVVAWDEMPVLPLALVPVDDVAEVPLLLAVPLLAAVLPAPLPAEAPEVLNPAAEEGVDEPLLPLVPAVERLLPWPAPVLPPPAVSELPPAPLPPVLLLLLPVPPAAWLLVVDWLPADRLLLESDLPPVLPLLPRARSLSLPRLKSELPALLSSEDRLDPRPALL
jgi:hypothetical protein